LYCKYFVSERDFGIDDEDKIVEIEVDEEIAREVEDDLGGVDRY